MLKRPLAQEIRLVSPDRFSRERVGSGDETSLVPKLYDGRASRLPVCTISDLVPGAWLMSTLHTYLKRTFEFFSTLYSLLIQLSHRTTEQRTHRTVIRTLAHPQSSTSAS